MGLFSIFSRKEELPAPAPAPAPTTPSGPSRSRGRSGRGLVSAIRMLFGSAESNRLTGDWGSTPVPADWIIHRHQRTLVARSREQLFNNDYFKAYRRICRQNIVGASGLVFQSKAMASVRSRRADKKGRAAVEKAFKDWGRRENCDIAGKLSWRGFQNHCINSVVSDGEFMLRKYTGVDAGKYGFMLGVIDPVRCPVDYDRFDLADGGFIRHGIEFNRYGRPVAYHFIDESPKRSWDAYSYAGRAFVRIPAEEIIHGFLVEIVGQKRGLPWLSTGLFRLKQMGALEDAAIVNARVGAGKVGVIEFDGSSGPEDNDVDSIDEIELTAEPGTFAVLPNGAKLSKFDPTYPSGEFAPFMKAMLRSIAAGGGVSYHALAQDLEGVNFSSIRQGTLDEREHFKELQEWLIEEAGDPVVSAWFDNAILRGAIVRDDGTPLPAARADQYSPYEFQGRRWEWIDPNADMKAAEGRKNNLLASPGALIREQGRDPETVWQEWGEDIRAMKAAGIPDEFIKLAMGQKLAPAADNDTGVSPNVE
jgi:lambda family phage portal protein